ncbi:hypothetical protein ACWENA_08375 [Streptomyces sp. NPDC004779]
MTHPTEALAAAAEKLRHPRIAEQYGPELATPLAQWLDAYAQHYVIWRGPHMSKELAAALAVARAITGSQP